MPCKVTFKDGNTIEYVYAADGTKLQTVHKIDGVTTTRDYCGNAVYENGELKMLLNEYGYVSFPDRKFHFYLKDHQGNVRVVADAEGNVEEINDYYPFGGLMSSTAANNSQPYKYNGKELDRKAGLNLYDYGARFYDPVIGRFTTVDPMQEKFYPYSPYSYCLGNPVKHVDTDGKYVESVWDVLSLTMGAKSFWDNIKAGNIGAAVVDGLGVIVDGAAVALPFVPGGAGAAIKGVRAADDVLDAISGADKAADVAKTAKAVHGNSKASTKAQHAYDVVVGPVADDNTMETVQLYLSGILKAEEAVERLRYNKVNNQVSFHTLLALEPSTILRLIRLYRIPKIRFGRSQQDISQIGSMKSRNRKNYRQSEIVQHI